MGSSRNSGSRSRIKVKRDGGNRDVSDSSIDNSFQIQDESLSAVNSVPRLTN